MQNISTKCNLLENSWHFLAGVFNLFTICSLIYFHMCISWNLKARDTRISPLWRIRTRRAIWLVTSETSTCIMWVNIYRIVYTILWPSDIWWHSIHLLTCTILCCITWHSKNKTIKGTRSPKWRLWPSQVTDSLSSTILTAYYIVSSLNWLIDAGDMLIL